MKPTAIIILLTTIISISSFSQSIKTCDSPEESFEELNTISIKKCNVEEKKKKSSTRKITSSISSKKKSNRISHYVRKGTPLPSSRKKITTSVTKDVIFSVVDNIPLFRNCKNSKDKACFNKQFYIHFSKNFKPENAFENDINSRVFVQFTMKTNGDISNILVRGPKNSKNLEKEIKRVINALPTFQSGSHNGLPVNVKHSLPINLTSS